MTMQQLEKQQALEKRETPEKKVEQKVSFIPNTDVWETKDAWIMEMDMPGVSNEQVNVELDKDNLKVYGNTSDIEVPEGYTSIYSEYYTGNFERNIRLPKDVDFEKIEAFMKDGALRLVLPKQEMAKPRKITVKCA